MGIHIGKIIQKAIKLKGISVVEFAKKINYTRGNAYNIFNKQTIDTGLLVKINSIIGDNLFFNFITNEEMEAQVNKTDDMKKVKTALKQWDEFMQYVKAKEPEKKVVSSAMKGKSSKKPVKKIKR
ncbi:MAG: hypothetical protein V4565_12100 [Bacteroidota bacterium]